MKFLFIVQGEGRGHMTQAIALSDMLRRNGHEVVGVLLSISENREVPLFFIEKIGADVQTFLCASFSFSRDKKHINLARTFLKNMNPGKLKKYMNSIEFIHEQIGVLSPDVVVNFYEMLGSLTHLRYREKIPFVSIGHQFLLKHPEYKFGRSEGKKMMALRLHALLSNVGSTKTLALSFYKMDAANHERIVVVPPLLRKEVLDLKSTKGDYILGYMVNYGFAQEVSDWHNSNKNISLRVFWDKKGAAKETRIDDTLTYYTIDDKLFLENMATCRAYISTAGFESICEAFYLGKPVMMIPAHVEQEVNAADAESTGLGVVGKSFDLSKLLQFADSERPSNQDFREWVESAETVFLKELTIF